ncbi:DUF1638 domain-containing protein [Pararhodobacter oceanensis]|uniref:DUF1638 domain-containing protein n=1 Tax=Pararhodobacter oceanensis TaxID=2172121 RepID=A0A2T8HVW5_9RHOB|nr:DUF1638 domain-containing protein [Pararhodobacter oceanensis]PVH29579.1 hypothetical protein DDE20_05490 [Pararhodobacter oceanensis]
MTQPFPPASPAASDAQLTTQGLEASGSGKVLALACGALAHEILALKAMNGWDQLDLHCLPANLHLYPQKIPDAVEAAVHKFRDKYRRILVVYADCGTGGLLQSRCEALGVEMVEGPHCYSFFTGNEAFAERADDEITAFYLTDFLVRQFEAFVWRPMGFDRHPELIEMMFGNYETLIYLAQTDNPELDQRAEYWAGKLSLAYERRFTGYGDLAPVLERATRA